MNVLIRTPALSKQADGYVIKNPREIENAHTIKSVGRAADVLSLTSQSAMEELKEWVRGYDFTLISTNELANIGSKLREYDLIDGHVASAFICGNMEVDKNGHATGRDVKYNAIAMFNQMLGDNKAYAREWPMYAQQESFKNVSRMLLSANQVVNALSYFASSAGNDLSVSIQA